MRTAFVGKWAKVVAAESAAVEICLREVDRAPPHSHMESGPSAEIVDQCGKVSGDGISS